MTSAVETGSFNPNIQSAYPFDSNCTTVEAKIHKRRKRKQRLVETECLLTEDEFKTLILAICMAVAELSTNVPI